MELRSKPSSAWLFHGRTFQLDSDIADIADVAHHKYQVLEECLFYKLTKDADQMQGKSNALMLLPPTVAAGETLDVQVLHAGVRQMWMNEVFKEMNINGYLKLVSSTYSF
ncbi:hypothetical protein ANCCAN_07564 [Ancylostoma caninum]|uniref:Uncharacterized protein n=2 Tax=Ancylostoma TaxID=29169 RepID=A0A368GPU8_ANCCA|nr:hypothetical protein ANCCAN_07564 [Ancylostoma caninum]